HLQAIHREKTFAKRKSFQKLLGRNEILIASKQGHLLRRMLVYSSTRQNNFWEHFRFALTAPVDLSVPPTMYFPYV
ncbi:unnamed protein product, partial [Brassicogethes aeneus]